MSSSHIELTDDLAAYLRRVSLHDTDLLRRLRAETAALPSNIAMMQISPEQGQFMGLLIRLMGAKKALEIGVFTGYSSLSVALALPPEGQLIACDVSEEYTAIARRYWAEAEVAAKIELRLGPALKTLDELLTDGHAASFDFAFIDADKANYGNYYERTLQLLRPGGLVAIDNVLWSGRVIDPAANDADTQAIRRFNEALFSDGRIQLSMLPIGDGLTLAQKNA